MPESEVVARVATVINIAWPCFAHYCDPIELAGPDSDRRVADTLRMIAECDPEPERGVPPPVREWRGVTAEMTKGNERHPACLALAAAITRCVPALRHAVITDGGPELGDEQAMRRALLGLHLRRPDLDPAPDTTDAPTSRTLTSPPAAPAEVGAEWRWMVRLTLEGGMGGPLGAFDWMPMRCFAELGQVRNWAIIQVLWDYQLRCEPRDDEAARLDELVQALDCYEGTTTGEWRLPWTDHTLHIELRPPGSQTS